MRLACASRHGKDSGLSLLGDSVDALLARIVLADRAKYSIDLQYYLFHNDATGKLLAQHLIAAADRGVRVRVLLDDLHMAGNDEVLRALDGHPGLDIRLFNPLHERTASMWGMGKQFAGDFSRLNRRMHNKSFIVDSAVAVVGGRNIGDEYFDVAGDVNFRDLDVLVIGPVIPEISSVFDAYWNSAPSVPIGAFRLSSTDPDRALCHPRIACQERARTPADRLRGPCRSRASATSRARTMHRNGTGARLHFSPTIRKRSVRTSIRDDLHLAPRIREWLDGAQHRIVLSHRILFRATRASRICSKSAPSMSMFPC